MSDTAGEKLTPEMQQFLVAEQMKLQMQQMVAKITEVCFDKCLSSPGRSLSSREGSCLRDCSKRYIEATQFVIQRFEQKSQAAQGSGFD